MRRGWPPVALAAALAACAAPSLHPDVAPLAASSLGLGAATPAIDAAWWTAFGDPQLDRIMADALDASPTLAGALARIRIADAAVAGRRADRSPRLDLDAQEQRQRLSDKYIIPPPYAGSSRWVGTAQLDFAWTIDFWGRQAAMLAQARGSARAAGLDAAAARLALTAAVAQTYVELVRAERLADIATRFVESRGRTVDLVASRIRNRLASDFDARAAQTLLSEARQAQLRAAGRRETVVHALAALAGRGAEYDPTVRRATLSLDAALPLPTTLPADLLGRRPDLLAGLARIEAASAGAEVARTAYYPNVDLLGFVGSQALGLGALFTGGALTFGGGPSIHLPIFAGGRRRADYAGAVGRLDAATADYNEAVARAVRDAADAVSAVRTSAADSAEQARLTKAVEDVVRLDGVRVRAGLGSQLDLLDAGTRVLAAEQASTDIAADGVIHRVQLVVALGGGFDPARGATADPARGVTAEATPARARP